MAAAKKKRAPSRAPARKTPRKQKAGSAGLDPSSCVLEAGDAALAETYVRPRGEAAIARHALVVHYGCPPSAMGLVRAHGDVEGGHRHDAWTMLLDHVGGETISKVVVDTCMEALARWHRYRDGVAERMGLSREAASAAE